VNRLGDIFLALGAFFSKRTYLDAIFSEKKIAPNSHKSALDLGYFLP
jgi:hypothetical protein